MHPETPDRDLQRELIYQQIKNPISRELVRSSIPTTPIDYHLSTPEGKEMGEKLNDLIRKEGGRAFKYIFALATVAQPPYQLANAFNALSGIAHWQVIRDEEKTIDRAKTEFLNDCVITPFASDGARAIQADLIARWEQNPNERDVRFRFVSIPGKYGRDRLSSFSNRKVEDQYWTEAYVLTILDPNTPFALRKALLDYSLDFHHGYKDLSGDPRFTAHASIYKNASAEWVFPDLFETGAKRDVKDWEIAGLRKTIADMQKQLEGRPQHSGNLDAERAQLKSLMERMERMVREGEEKIQIYKEIGKHPLEALGIGYATWKATPHEQREQLIRNVFRAGAKKYHYQVPSSDPSYNSLLAELANREFTRLTNAYDYLLGHMDKDEF